MRFAQYDEETEEDQSREDLYLELLAQQTERIARRPDETCLIGQKTTDKEEQRHAEQHQERQ